MDPAALTYPGEVPLDVEEQIDRICVRFEQRWQAPPGPALRPLLAEVADNWQPALFRELVMVELDYRLAHRENPRLDEYIDTYPEFADLVRAVFPAPSDALNNRTDSDAMRGAGFERQSLPRRVGNYRIIRELGRGGMGVVYKAIQAPLDRPVALKVLAPLRSTDTEVQRFRREAEVAARLHHTNIVPIFEAGQDGDVRYYAMQYIQGHDLHRFIKKVRRHERGDDCAQGAVSTDFTLRKSAASLLEVGGGLRRARRDPTPTACEAGDAGGVTRDDEGPAAPAYFRRVAAMGAQVASALAYAHDQGVVHRDIKPTNLLLDSRGTVWITDFGLVKTNDSDLTSGGDIVGTLRYLPPERLKGICDSRSDIYSLGLTLYELATLEAAFPEADQIDLLEAIHTREPREPRSLDSRIPRDLETIIVKAGQKRPGDRYQRAADLAEDLRRFLAGEPTLARRIGPVERALIWSKRRPWAALGLTLFCAALVLVAVMSVMFARAARRHAAELNEALTAVRKSEATARQSDLAARRQESQALQAQGQSNRVAARLAFANALSLAEKGSVERSLFEMIRALEIDPPEAEEKSLQRVIRSNLAAWGRQTATLRYVFHLPGSGPKHDPLVKRSAGDFQQIFVSRAGDRGGFVTIGKDRMARVWSFDSGTAMGPSFALAQGRCVLSVSDDGERLAISGVKNEIQSLDTGVIVRAPVNQHEKNGKATFTPMSFAGPSVMATTSDNPADHGRVRFWDQRTAREFPVQLSLERGDCYKVIAGDQGQPLLFVSRTGATTTPEARLEAFDLQTGATLTHPYPLPHKAESEGTEPRGRYFVALPRGETLRSQIYIERDGPICLWDLDTGKLASSPWTSPVASGYQLLTGEDRVLAVQCRDDRIRLFDLETGRQLGGTLTIPGMVTTYFPTHVSVGMALSTDGTVLVTLEADGMVRGWDIKDLLDQSRHVQRSFPAYLPPVRDPARGEPVVALTADGSRAFFGRGDQGRVIDTRTGQPVGPPIRHALLYQAHFSPDGEYLATATTASPRDEPPIVRIWDLRRHEVALYLGPKYIHGLRFSPDSRRLAVACVGQTSILDARDGKLLRTLSEQSCAVNTAFSRDGRLLAVAYQRGWPGLGGGLRIWDTELGAPAGAFHPAPDHVFAAPKLEFVAGGKALLLLDATANELRRLYPLESSDAATALAANRPNLIGTWPGLDLVATANSGGTLEVWSIMDGQRRWVAPSSGEVKRLQMSPDGKTLAVVDSDRSVRLWDTETGWTLGPPLAHPADIADLTFTADGGTLVAATRAGQVFRWSVPQPMTGGIDECAAAIQRKIGMAARSGELVPMNPDEWRALSMSGRK